ncbi:hypothetical protein J7T55_006248 [Diaporthe amygdali]|uniref:uncharacterized protein n=1 Tax=Phomopsis amygdali TaxID=1214568 RepID=UPI0022FE1E9A|nr:uncharacterized protein J7T55_006248 [Diaporthe amygdali]KAJ0124905.1 hypothetical protein J7T55_006248 [Diaporthe amygdali]
MSSAVADLENNLQAMLALKPPGVSGSKISTLTSLCIANVQSESVLVQKIYTHFKKAPSTHKLGVLYVVDSVTRKWLEQAKQQGQPVGSSAPDGSFAAGVNRVTELMPVLMNDIISSAPQDQREKIRKLVDIWEKGQTFPGKMIEGFKDKLNNQSTTPPGSPPPNTLPSLSNRPTPAPPVPANIMETLANIARLNANNTHNTPASSAPAPAPVSTPYAAAGPSSTPAAPPSFMNALQQGMPFLPTSQAAAPTVNPPAPPFMAPQPQPAQLPNFGAQNGIPAAAPGLQAGATDPTALQVALIQQLIQKGVPPEQIAAVVKALGSNTPVAAPQVSQPSQGSYSLPPNEPTEGLVRDLQEDTGSIVILHVVVMSGALETMDVILLRVIATMIVTAVQKWIEHDPSLPSGCIKVLSRTLFVGGVNCSENELRSIFNGFGTVQTCIVNKEKRHAFVKMYSRKDAVNAKEAMDSGRSPDAQLRTRWGVGFGPRDCSDYQTGISVIPIHKLTEADRKWMLTAPYGGSGGQTITHGMVVEEPDIEIGAGVSSKAISRRMQTDKGGSHGPKSSHRDSDDRPERGGRHGRRGGGGRGDHRNRDDDRPANNHSAPAEPVVPAFPYGISTDSNGFPVFPPGFAFPAPDATTNPPY